MMAAGDGRRKKNRASSRGKEQLFVYSGLGRGTSEPSFLISGFAAPGKDARIFLFVIFAVAERSMVLVVSPPGPIFCFICCHDLKNEFSWGSTLTRTYVVNG